MADSPVRGLIDTGAILALLNREDTWHRACGDVFGKFRLPLLTSEAVLTEVFHLLERDRLDIEDAWGLIDTRAVEVAAIANDELPEIHSLMTRYADRPMDFADATLVYLAKREKLSTIFTVDRDDFATYRIDGRRAFAILPSRRP
jgi:predicted nucleic acid-binding protein